MNVCGGCPIWGDKSLSRTRSVANSGTHDGCVHAHYKCYVQVRPERLAEGWTRGRIIEAITARGVHCFQGSCSAVYLEKAFDSVQLSAG